MAEVESGEVISSGVGLAPINGHHVAEVPCQGPPDLALIHDFFLCSDLTQHNHGFKAETC